VKPAERMLLKEIRAVSSDESKTFVNYYNLLQSFTTFFLGYMEMDQGALMVHKVFNKLHN
jgi:hypothetical protein